MSEYQFYDFLAIDRPLTAQEREAVSSISSRTEATMYSATFVYHYSGLRADEREVLANYFDAMLYLANWGSSRLMFRFPKTAVDVELLKQYEFDRSVVVISSKDHVILDMSYHEEEGYGWVEGEGLLATMVGLRQAIMNGDMRAPYLAWLQAVSIELSYEWQSTKKITEAPIPYNLNQSSRELDAFINFFQIEEELVAAAAKFSSSYSPPSLDIDQALAKLAQSEKDDFLKQLAEGVPSLQQILLKRLQELQPNTDTKPTVAAPKIVTVLEKIDEARAEIELREQEKLNLYLDGIAKKETRMWQEIHMLISQKKVKPYEQAIEKLLQLRQLAERDKTMDSFKQKIDDIFKTYPTLKGLHSRMRYKGLV